MKIERIFSTSVLTMFVLCKIVYASPMLLTSFDNEDLNNWEILGSSTSFKISREHATDGKTSARILFPKYRTGGFQYPGIHWDAQNGLPTDWSQYTRLTFDYYNPRQTNCVMSCNIRDSVGGRLSQSEIKLTPGSGKVTIFFKGKALNLQSIDYFRLYAWEPTVDGEVYIDNIRLDVGPAPPKNSKAIRVANNLHNKLSWEEPIYQGEADHAVTYRIYRGTDSGFSPTVPVAEVKETAWVDNNIKDRQYFYVIKAVDKLGIEGEASEELVVKKVGIRGVLVYFPIAVILGMLLVN